MNFYGGTATGKIFEYTEAEIREKAETYIPEYMIEGIMGWVMEGRVPGGFLQAVLRNDLMEAAAHADGENGPRLKDWVVFLHNFTPGGCHGSHADYNEWFDLGGLNGMLKTLQSKAQAASDEFEKRDDEVAHAIRE